MLPLELILMGRANIRDREKSDKAVISRADRLSAKENFFLRAKSIGYDFGKDPDPDGLLPTVFPK